MVRAHRRTTARGDILSIRTRGTSQHPETRKNREDETAYGDQPQVPGNKRSHQSGPRKNIIRTNILGGLARVQTGQVLPHGTRNRKVWMERNVLVH